MDTLRAVDHSPSNALPQLAARSLAAIAAAKLVLHLALATRYGFHRDELYYVVCGLDLSWCYVDHAPFTPLLARAAYELCGPSLFALRALAGATSAALAVLAGALARELGGGAWAQRLAALAVLGAPLFLLSGGLFQTVGFDQLAWGGALLLLVRALRDDRPERLLAFGAALGLGLLVKHTIALLALSTLLALAFTNRRTWLATRWPWLGAATALALAAPILWWQVEHGWPTLEFAAANSARSGREFPPAAVAGLQLVLMGPANLALVALGGLHLVRSRAADGAARWRPLALLFPIALAPFLLRGGKPYYVGALYPLLFAAGATALELRAHRRAWRRGLWLAPAGLVLGALPLAWMVLPLASRKLFAEHQEKWPHSDFREMFGWPELVEQLDRARDGLDAAEREHVGVLSDSYGEASVVTTLGAAYGLPRGASPHNQLFFRGPPLARDGSEPRVVLAIASSRAWLERCFEDIQDAGALEMPLGVRNEASFKRLYICRRPRASWSTLWPTLRGVG